MCRNDSFLNVHYPKVHFDGLMPYEDVLCAPVRDILSYASMRNKFYNLADSAG